MPGKDPSKVDRSAAYAARHIAKNIVAAGIADEVLVQLSYAIGVSEPVSVNVDTFGTHAVPEERILDAIQDPGPESIVTLFTPEVGAANARYFGDREESGP